MLRLLILELPYKMILSIDSNIIYKLSEEFKSIKSNYYLVIFAKYNPLTVSNCYFCNEKINEIPYRCTFCGMLFCSEHRIPENHACPFDLRKSSEIEDSLSRFDLLYQNSLDFVDKDLTVAKIYDYVTTKQMDDLEATELLTYFIENTDDVDTRRISIQAFKVLKLKNKFAFNTLERCILSEDNPIVKKTAIDVIKFLFPKKSQRILKWMRKDHNNSTL